MRYFRFKDLQQRNIVRNWTTLTRLMREQGFPAGTRIGAQARAWEEAEVEAWLDSRRIASPVRDAPAAALPVQEAAHIATRGSARGRHKQAPTRPTAPKARSLSMPNSLDEGVPRR